MSPITARSAVLSLALALSLAACSDGAPPAAGDASGPLPGQQASGDRITAQITGAGATFIYPLLAKWSDDYNKATGARINYQSIGSGGGIAQIKAGTVDFGSSDKPLPPPSWPPPAWASSRWRSAAWCRRSTCRASRPVP